MSFLKRRNQTRSPEQSALARWAGAARREGRRAIAFALAASLAWALVAWFFASAVAAAAAGENPAAPAAMGAAAAGLRALLIWRGELAADRAGRAMASAARREILDAAARQGAVIFAGADAGTRASQIIDRTRKLFGYAARWLPGRQIAIWAPLLLLAVVFSQSWLAGALLSVSVLVLPLFIWLTASGAAAAAKAEQASLESLAGAFQARAAHAGVIRAFRGVKRERAALENAAQALRASTMRVLRQAFLATAVLEFFASISIALVAVYVGFKLLGVFPFGTGETLTLREGLTALVLAPEFFAPIRRLSSLHHDRADGVAASSVIAPWLERGAKTPLVRRPRLSAAPSIHFDQTLLALGETAVAGPVDVRAGPGAITVFAGPSGAGKSSCLLALLGLRAIAGGAVRVDDAPLAPGESLAESAAYMRQTPWIAEGTLRENLKFAAPEASDADLYRALETADARGFVDADPRGLDRPLARFGAGLSGGERQRLALARAMLRAAPVLLLDEPTAHLDAEAEARFLRWLTKNCAGRTILIASHRPAVIAAADQVAPLTPITARKVAA